MCQHLSLKDEKKNVLFNKNQSRDNNFFQRMIHYLSLFFHVTNWFKQIPYLSIINEDIFNDTRRRRQDEKTPRYITAQILPAPFSRKLNTYS